MKSNLINKIVPILAFGLLASCSPEEPMERQSFPQVPQGGSPNSLGIRYQPRNERVIREGTAEVNGDSYKAVLKWNRHDQKVFSLIDTSSTPLGSHPTYTSFLDENDRLSGAYATSFPEGHVFDKALDDTSAKFMNEAYQDFKSQEEDKE